MNRPIHIEILKKRQSTLHKEYIKELVHTYLQNFGSLTPGASITNEAFDENENCELKSHVESIFICDVDQRSEVSLTSTDIVYHVYSLNAFEAETDTINGGNGPDDEFPAATLWTLPSQDFHGLWETLIFDSDVKQDTLHVVESTLIFSDNKVNTNIINLNRVMLLHGPPGTGKTSLCKALAQKLTIRLSDRYERGQLVEINSHSLFSKWFSESGKLVLKLFNKIKETIEDPHMLVCVLIDEVESLTHARKSAMNGLEPSDSIRVVNAILTQIDQMQKYPNVLILCTSNITGAIDLAFIDRADIKQYIGLPSEPAIYQIYHSCLTELMRVCILVPKEQLFIYRLLKMCQFSANESTMHSLELLSIAKLSKGLSGRTLRKITLLAHALYISTRTVSLDDFLKAMKATVEKHTADGDLCLRELNAIKIDDEMSPIRNEPVPNADRQNGW